MESHIVLEGPRETPAGWIETFWPVRGIHACQALATISANLLLIGIFYYMSQQFGWQIQRNLLLSAGQGATYVLGSLSAEPFSRWLGRRSSLAVTQVFLIGLPLMIVLSPRPGVIVPIMLACSFLSALQWPVIESLISSGVQGQTLSRRLTIYNLHWSGLGSITVALMGNVIQNWHAGIFVLSSISSAGVLVMALLSKAPAWQLSAEAHAEAEPEPELLQMRSLALWLARISLPSSYLVSSSLSAMMPTLPVVLPLATRYRTLVNSVWFLSRFWMFLMLGMTTFWHTRPRLVLAASALMLVSFLGVTIRPTDLWGPTGSSQTLDLIAMIAWQFLLGVSLGIIYSASLYFGMVLSQGSTEHGGYHEALIGLGGSIGPAAAATAHMLQPHGIALSVATVAIMTGATLIGATWVAYKKPTSQS